MEELRIEQRGHCRWLILNRPQRRNALTRNLIRALHGAVMSAASYEDVRCIVLAGAGPAFCAGVDMAEFRQTDDLALMAADGEIMSRLLESIVRSPKPVIARVHGAAMGSAVGLLAAADFVIATTDTRLAMSEVRFGLVPAVISPFVLRAIGRRSAQTLMLSGQPINAHEAQQIGLVQQVVEPNEVEAAVDRLTAQLQQSAPGAMAEIKRLLDLIDGRTLDDARDLTVQILADRRLSDEGQEGMQSFLDKRQPSWGLST